jgi:LPXTG-motif cell wall-anchored protein
MKKRLPNIVVGLTLWLILGLVLPALGAPDATPAMPTAPSNQAAPGQAAPNKPAPMTDIHDIRPPVAVGVDAPWLIPALLALAGVVLLAALWWWWRRRKKRPIETIVPELPPEMIAMQALDSIGDVRGLEGKSFYFHLSAILRQYVFGRFAVGAPEMTTEEFLPCIDRLPVDRELGRRLKQLCRAMDPVKFGGVTTVEKQMETDLFFARAFVRQTTPTTVAEQPQGDVNAAPKALPAGAE